MLATRLAFSEIRSSYLMNALRMRPSLRRTSSCNSCSFASTCFSSFVIAGFFGPAPAGLTSSTQLFSNAMFRASEFRYLRHMFYFPRFQSVGDENNVIPIRRNNPEVLQLTAYYFGGISMRTKTNEETQSSAENKGMPFVFNRRWKPAVRFTASKGREPIG